MTVLIVDDEAAERERLRAIVERAGRQVRMAETAAEALRLHRQARSDLLILDTELPDSTGVDLLRRIRLEPDLRNCEVILANPYPTDEEVIRGFHYFTDAHMERPLDAEWLTGWLEPHGPPDGPYCFQDCWTRKWDAERQALPEESSGGTK